MQGVQGITGLQGTAGYIGADGAQGTQGLQGANGSNGSQGIQGLQGTQGIQGLLGTQGIIGPASAYAQTSMPTGVTNGSTWLDTDGTSTSIFQQYWRKAVTVAGTTISGVDDYSLTLAYTVGFEDVYLNGVLLVRAVDYTATDGTSIVLVTPTLVGDYVEIITTATFVAANTYTQSAANAAFVQNAGYFAAGKNKIINGDFGVWQRGTSVTNATNTYTADRWKVITNGSPTSMTTSRQTFTPGAAPVASYEGTYFYRNVITTIGTLGDCDLNQYIEDVRTFAGQTATISFWAKADAARTLTLYIGQNFGSGGSGTVTVNPSGTTFSLTTSWQRFTATYSIPSISGKTVGTSSFLFPVFRQAVAAGSTLDLWGVQFEAGSTATAFQTATGTIQGELAACQRYLPVIPPLTEIYGYCYATNSYVLGFKYPVTARVAPTGITVNNISGTVAYNQLNSAAVPSAVTLNAAASGIEMGSILVTGTGTAGNVGRFGLGVSSSIFFTGCEL